MTLRRFCYRRMMRRKNLYILSLVVITSLILTFWSTGFSSDHSNRVRKLAIYRAKTKVRTSFIEAATKSWHDKQDKFPRHFVEGQRFEMHDSKHGKVEHFLLPGSGDLSEGDCVGLTGPSYAYINVFQPLDSHDSNNYVFSAYYDQRNGNHYIRVIGVMSVKETNDILCQLWFISRGHISVKVADAVVELLYPDNHTNRDVESVLISCLNERKGKTPYFVSVVRSKKCHYGRNRLRVDNLIAQRPQRPSIAVCIPPIRNKYHDINTILETFVLNKLFGAEQVFMYNSSSTYQVRRLIQALVFDKMVTLIPWNLPQFSIPNKSPYLDEMAMRHDCLMRGTGHFRHLLYADLNEIFVPRRDSKWLEVFLRYRLDKNTPPLIAYSMVQFNQRFPSDKDTILDKEVNEVKSIVLLKTKREGKYFRPFSHSSYIVDPLQIMRLGLFNVVEYMSVGLQREETILSSEALLHRYSNGSLNTKSPVIVDQNILRFQDLIIYELRDLRRKYARIIESR